MNTGFWSIDYFDETIMGNAELWDIQCEIWKSVFENKYTAVRSCFASGKTFVAARIALHFLYSFGIMGRSTKVITTAPTHYQVEKQLWKEVRKQKQTANCRDGSIVLSGNVLSTAIDIDDDWFAIGFRPRETEPERFQGWHAHNILVIFDEAAGIPPIFWGAKEGLMAGGNVHFLAIGNPSSPVGEFYNCFSSPLYNKIQISAFNTPNFEGITETMLENMSIEEADNLPLAYDELITPGWVRRRMDDWGKSSPFYLSKVRGDFADEGEDTMIPLILIENAERKYESKYDKYFESKL